jgi:glycine/D-amino acid oxidase-like deaminating enzyme
VSVRTAKKKYDVVVVGGGPLGWCAAQMLSQSNIKTLLIEPKPLSPMPYWMTTGLGVFWPSLNDPPTRALVAHGIETASYLQNFCTHGVRFATTFLGKKCTQPLPVFRLGIEAHEISELQTAQKQHLGLTADIALGAGIFKEENEGRILVSRLDQKLPLQRFCADLKKSRVVDIREGQGSCTLHLDTGEQLSSEMVVLATGYQLAQLCPWLSQMLVPMADISTAWLTGIPVRGTQTPFGLRAANGHVAALFSPKKDSEGRHHWHISLSGPRFLLPRAGAGLSDFNGLTMDTLTPKIKNWLSEKLLPQVPATLLGLPDEANKKNRFPLQLESVSMGVDCLPCDELPVLGELGTQGRILGGTGWLGCGWSAGFRSAQIIADLVVHGKSEKLLPLLKPLRWRSGMSDGVTGMT